VAEVTTLSCRKGSVAEQTIKETQMKTRLMTVVASIVIVSASTSVLGVSDTPDLKFKGRFIQAEFIRTLDFCTSTYVSVSAGETIYLRDTLVDNGQPRLAVSIFTYDWCNGVVNRDAWGYATPAALAFGHDSGWVTGTVRLTDGLSQTVSDVRIEGLNVKADGLYVDKVDELITSPSGRTKYGSVISTASVYGGHINDGPIDWAAGPSTYSAVVGGSTGFVKQ
jgi:hypothetical protein